MSKVYTDNIEKRTGGTAIALPASGKWSPTTQLDTTGTASATTFLRGDNSWAAVDTSGIQANMDDIALLAFKTQANGSLARYNLVDQTVDSFEDATGVDAGTSTGEVRDASNNYYFGGTSAAGDATGGTITYSGGKTIHSFTTGSNFITPSSGSVDYLVVAGGGGGGSRYGGGGGAGGMRTGSTFAVAEATFAITVGAGGAGGATGGSQNNEDGVDGSDSIFSTITSTGGGGGGTSQVPSGTGHDGGSGGGGSSNGMDGPGGSGNTPSTSPSQGNSGGIGRSGSNYPAGGGGGAGAVGGSDPGPANSDGGDGGVGVSSSITGSAVFYAGGGGGGDGQGSDGGGDGGNGGGGPAGDATADNGDAGTANTGGGGGSGGTNAPTGGGAGGTGIVIISYTTDGFTDITEGGNMSLVSTAQTAQAVPTKGDVVLTYTNGTGTTTLNTDLIASVSRDNGTTYTATTLALAGTTGGHNIATAHDVDISAQPSGSSMRWKVATANQSTGSKTTRVQAVSLGWS